MRSKSKLPMQPEKKWQSGGNEKQVIEVIVKKRPLADGFDQPAIDGIAEASR